MPNSALVMLGIISNILFANMYSVNLQHASCKQVFSIKIENSVDPYQMTSSDVINKSISYEMTTRVRFCLSFDRLSKI